MSDTFQGYTEGLNSPPSRMMAVTPNDAQDMATACRCINVAAAGSVRVTTVQGDTGTIYVAAGVAFPIRALRIWATGTDAAGIVAMY